MGDVVFGIYGFDFHQPRSVSGISLVPLFPPRVARTRAGDRADFFLTGYGRFNPQAAPIDPNARHDAAVRLADAMTFCQQQHVLVTRLIAISTGDSVEELVRSGRLADNVPSLQERPTIGSLVMEDGYSTESRTRLLELFLASTLQAPAVTPLMGAVYRQIEIWRLWNPLVELQHFLAFSGLEILGRAFGPFPDNKNAAVPIAGYLQSRGFNTPQTLVEEWTAARNGAFHRGLLGTTVPASGKAVDIADQLFALETLLADVCLKEMGFDDPHINWNRWADHQPFC